jgi:hypothetical protein
VPSGSPSRATTTSRPRSAPMAAGWRISRAWAAPSSCM